MPTEERPQSTSAGRIGNAVATDYWPIDGLRPGPHAIRQHSDAQITKIIASIEQFGFQCPPLVSADGELIAGVARVEAAKRLGFSELPVIIDRNLTAAQRKAFRIADNKLAEMASWDEVALKLEFDAILDLDTEFDLGQTGFETAQIDFILDGSESADEDNEDPADNLARNGPAVSRPGDVWVLGRHRLICGDACGLETHARLMLEGETARLVITDPPWNVAVNGHVGGLGRTRHREFVQASGEMSPAEFAAFLRQSMDRIYNALCDGGLAYVFIDWRSLETMLAAGRDAGLELINLIVWAKTNAGMGSFYRSRHELVCLFKKGRAAHRNNIRLGATGRYRTNIWEYAGVNSFGVGRMAQLCQHPTVKPIAMIADAIRDASQRGEVILDCFCGSGTTLMAAEKTGRVARCIELDPLYVDSAIRRFEVQFGIEAIEEVSGRRFAEISAERTAESPELLTAEPGANRGPGTTKIRRRQRPVQGRASVADGVGG